MPKIQRSKLASWTRRGISSFKRFLSQVCDRTARFLRFSRTQIRGGRRLLKRGEVYYVPLWLPIAFALLLASSVFWHDAAALMLRGTSAVVHWLQGSAQVELAEFFAPSVKHWSGDIGIWAQRHQVDPHLLATVMQIESCGHPVVVSGAGAQGLFQVMPFHFADGEDMLNPDINVKRGSAFLKHCLAAADGVIGLTLACYNGGASVINLQRENWARETRTYYRWGVGIYSDAVAGKSTSDTFNQWMAAGGERLCTSAQRELGF